MRASILNVAAAQAFATLLAGCAVGPDYAKPDMTLPAQWTQAATDGRGPSTPAASLDAWWRAFNDPLLDALMAEAIAGNSDVASAKAKIREARATRREAEAALGPSLTGSASASETGRQSALGGETMTTTTSATSSSGVSAPFQAGFDASWELDLFGANRRDAEAAGYGEEATEEDLRSTLLTLVGDVGADYAEARGYQEQIALARRTLASERRTADLTHVKFDAGSASAGCAAATCGSEAASCFPGADAIGCSESSLPQT